MDKASCKTKEEAFKVTNEGDDFMCKIDEGFTEKEILEETGWCKNCKQICPMAGKEVRDVWPNYPN